LWMIISIVWLRERERKI